MPLNQKVDRMQLGNMATKIRDEEKFVTLNEGLARFSQDCRTLVGINDSSTKTVLIRQILESIRRVQYVSVVRRRSVSALRANPRSNLFDPLKAAIHFQRLGDFEEACWMVFYFVHFGKNRKSGWKLARDVYGGLGRGQSWNWITVSAEPKKFRNWLRANQETLRGKDGIKRGFGNHRKYQSITDTHANGTGAAFESYVDWVHKHENHRTLFSKTIIESHRDPRVSFDRLYNSMNAVVSFGRTARFDYLTMIGKLCLANIEPGSTYMDGATGPLEGGRLLFGDSGMTRHELDNLLVQLDEFLDIGMQVIEDSLCNWQKSPSQFKPFRG